MATATKYLEYTINLTNKAQTETLQAAYPGGINIAPDAAALAYLAPIQNVGDDFSAPCCRSPWFILNSNYPRNVATFTKKVGGWFGLSFLFGTTYTYKWVGQFAYVASETPEINGTPTEVVTIAQRKFLVAFSAFYDGDIDNIGADAQGVCREASRHVDGFGWVYCADASGRFVTASTTQLGAAANNKTWERVYLKPVAMPTASQRFWRAFISGAAQRGCSLSLTPDGRIAVNNISDAGTETLQATSTDILALNTWYRLDVLIEAKTPGGNIRVYVNRKLWMTVTMPAGTGLSNTGNHTSSVLGSSAVPGTDEVEIHFCDWVGAEWPTADGSGDYTGIDWLNGSKIARIDVAAAHADNEWSGDYRYVNALNVSEVDSAATMNTTTSAGILALSMNDVKIEDQHGALGAVAFTACWNVNQLTSIAGTPALFGWDIAGAGADLTAIALVANTQMWVRRLYRPSGLTEPFTITPLQLRHVKYGNTSEARCYGVTALVELVGTFGEEDVPDDTAETASPTTAPPRRGIHVAPYPETIWARSRLAPVSPVIVHSGTYVGNATVTELQFRAPVTWLVIKRVDATQHGSFWWSSLVGQHTSGEREIAPRIHALIDASLIVTGAEDAQEQRTIVRITGNAGNVNASGVTYNYIAFQDPGARFSLNGAFLHSSTAFASFVNTLRNANFNPDGIFFHIERIGASDTSFSHYFKGPGHSANAGSPLNAAESVTIASKAAGALTSLVTLHTSGVDPVGYACFRMDDNSSDPNKHKVLKIVTWTGDGAASRTISLPNSSGLRPLYAIVSPENAAAYHRCPGDTGSNSHSMSSGTVSTTAITSGGIDQITVGSTLNANGVDYNAFIILGSATAGNNGWSIDGEFAYVEPDAPEGDYDDPDDAIDPIDPDPEDPDPDPGPGDGDDCDAGDVCVEATTRMVNLALLKIGVQHFLSNYCTETVKEAQVARKVFEVAVRYTLRMFPWPFATKYAALSLAVTQPNNEDWTYSYRLPSDCIYARRIVVARNKAVDPKGPPFMQSADSSGGLLFANQANAVLEYTCRPTCVSYVADALFTEAFAWKLGAEMAPGLSRMTEVVTHCLDQFKLAIEKAESDIKPGVPGKVPATDPADLDTTAAQIAANLGVINRALLRIGARTIANYTTDQSREAIAVRLVFEDELQATLRDFPWAFATKYVEPALVGGTATDPVNLDWQYSYRAPSDCVMVRRLVTARGRSYERNPDPFRMAEDATGGLIFAMTDEVTIEYTAREAGTVAKADAKFRDAFAWRIAAATAASLAQVDPDYPDQHGRGPEMPQDARQRHARKDIKASQRLMVARWAWAKYQEALSSAATTDANEKQEEKPGDADWILDRGIGEDESL
jgi:hypothetical protein